MFRSRWLLSNKKVVSVMETRRSEDVEIIREVISDDVESVDDEDLQSFQSAHIASLGVVVVGCQEYFHKSKQTDVERLNFLKLIHLCVDCMMSLGASCLSAAVLSFGHSLACKSPERSSFTISK